MIILNKELLATFGQLAVGTVIVMVLIVIACLVTPKIARFIEKKYPKLETPPPERVDGENKGSGNDLSRPEDYKVKGIFEVSKDDDFDPNYKIYNTDIYGVDFKHGKKQKRKDG